MNELLKEYSDIKNLSEREQFDMIYNYITETELKILIRKEKIKSLKSSKK
jgi:hypothetical protein